MTAHFIALGGEIISSARKHNARMHDSALPHVEKAIPDAEL